MKIRIFSLLCPAYFPLSPTSLLTHFTVPPLSLSLSIMALCSAKTFVVLFILSAVPVAYIISLEIAQPSTHVYHYHSSGFLRECAKWDADHRRFLISFLEGGIGAVTVPEDHSPGAVLEESVVVRDSDLAGNASLGLAIDRPRNRVIVAVGDVIGNRYSAVAAYDLSTWQRLFLTKLSGPSKSVKSIIATSNQLTSLQHVVWVFLNYLTALALSSYKCH